jgi:hypothetical protein
MDARYPGARCGQRQGGYSAPNRTSVLARPTGFERADAINIRIPIDLAEELLTVGESA